ncbi:S49 family peptidase [Ferruginibacter yonginensis]|uniref:S49 family peptidase n=1 Tax=Ferruginibacter yonginensis TaxID=1310416 RepID=A0ABV8QNS9_9BACT
MSFHTASALLRGAFLIERQYAASQLPLVLSMIRGNMEEHQPVALTSRQQTPKRVLVKSAAANKVTNVFVLNPYQSPERLPYDSIAMVNIIGPVLKYGDICSYGTNQINDLIQRLSLSDRVVGIILNIDSPGGQADGTGMLYDTIRAANKTKPVVSLIQDGMAASAGYWIAAGGREIYCTQATDMFGSIGAYTTLYDFTEYFANEGIKIFEIYAPQSPDKNKDYYDALAGNDAAIKNKLAFLVDQFKASVTASRGPRLKAKGDEPFTGKMYNAKEAKSMGLIDGIKPLSGVVDRITQLINLKQ